MDLPANLADPGTISRYIAICRKAAFESLTRFMREKLASVVVHTLDLIQENLLRAIIRDHDIEEVPCRVAGSDDCEFKIKLEAK